MTRNREEGKDVGRKTEREKLRGGGGKMRSETDGGNEK